MANTDRILANHVRNATFEQVETNSIDGDHVWLRGRAALGRRNQIICEFVDELISCAARRHMDAGLRRS